jgi:transcriptional regulator with XRE-family HTH domain
MKRLTTAEKALQICEWTETGQAKEWRVLAGLSLRESADSCEVTSAAILRWERGERRPRGRNVGAYYKLLSRLAADAERELEAA